MKGATVGQAFSSIQAYSETENQQGQPASKKKKKQAGKQQQPQQQQQQQNQQSERKPKKDASSKKLKLPDNFKPGISETPLYPNTSQKKLTWCKNHHWCTHVTENCTSPDSSSAQIKKGIKKLEK